MTITANATPKAARKAIKETKKVITVAIAGPMEHLVVITKAEATLIIKNAEISGYIINLFDHDEELAIGLSEE